MYKEIIDTPALIIDKDIMMGNIRFMQDYADKNKVNLRPHTKTHKIAELARLQMEEGAKGITVAKTEEAEVMLTSGIKDIFIANQIVGRRKLEKIKEMNKIGNVSFGIDSLEHIEEINQVFKDTDKKAEVLIEIEVGENRSGIIEEKDFIKLLDAIKNSDSIRLKGIFSHDGNSYKAKDYKELEKIFYESQERTLKFDRLAREKGFNLEVVSIGSTPSLMHGYKILEGITEIRPGTYILMDASQGNAIKSHERCAATILSTVISRPTKERVITDVGAKGLTAQARSIGICKTKGKGLIKEYNIPVDDVYDEHAIIYNEDFRTKIKIGDKIEIIPNHICPVCNLYDEAYLISRGEILEVLEITARGKMG